MIRDYNLLYYIFYKINDQWMIILMTYVYVIISFSIFYYINYASLKQLIHKKTYALLMILMILYNIIMVIDLENEKLCWLKYYK
jgi:hypothetical protein